jgi:hypothetical protein|tara:strand:- start:340 stop:696 length:357 start_codon:yes stop_codon:yes gene_type:complete
MSLIYKNITGNTAVAFDEVYGTLAVNTGSISLCNIHDTDSVDVDLYYYNAKYEYQDPTNWNEPTETATTYYILKNTTIPKGVTLKLNEDNSISFKKPYSLLIKLSASDSALDVIINTN